VGTTHTPSSHTRDARQVPVGHTALHGQVQVPSGTHTPPQQDSPASHTPSGDSTEHATTGTRHAPPSHTSPSGQVPSGRSGEQVVPSEMRSSPRQPGASAKPHKSSRPNGRRSASRKPRHAVGSCTRSLLYLDRH